MSFDKSFGYLDSKWELECDYCDHESTYSHGDGNEWTPPDLPEGWEVIQRPDGHKHVCPTCFGDAIGWVLYMMRKVEL